MKKGRSMGVSNRALLISAMLFSLACFQGCATLMNGTHQSLMIHADTTSATLLVDGSYAGRDSAKVNLSRGSDHLIDLRLANGETRNLILNRKTSNWVWGNGVMFLYGLGGVLIDYLDGAAYDLVPEMNGTSSGIRISEAREIDPWKTGTWHGSASAYFDLKRFGEPIGGDQLQTDFGFQWVEGKNDWPLEIVLNVNTSSAADVDTLYNFEIMSGGIRKTFYLDNDRLHPFVSGGLSLMQKSTRPTGGLPVGFWFRGGVDLRMSSDFFVGPYLGYSKYETTTAGTSTGGILGGVAFGKMW